MSQRCGCLVACFCYHLIAKPGNKTAAPSWPDPYVFSIIICVFFIILIIIMKLIKPPSIAAIVTFSLGLGWLVSYRCPYMLWLGCRFYFIWHWFALDPILTGYALLPHPYDISWAIMRDHVLDWRNQSIVCLPWIYYRSIRPHGTFWYCIMFGGFLRHPNRPLL